MIYIQFKGDYSKEYCEEVEEEIDDTSPQDGSCTLLQAGEGGLARETEREEQVEDHDWVVSANTMRIMIYQFI